MIKVSIIMPVYNAANYLSTTLDSVAAQTFTDYELIAINDGSQDTSQRILESYLSQIPQLKIINQSNSGVSSTRNKGIELANGKYICFLDADDYLSPNYLSILYEHAENYQSDIICCSYYTFSGNKEIRCEILCNSTRYVTFADLRALGHATSPCTKLYKRELIIKSGVQFNPKSTYGEDYFFNWKLYILTENTYFIDIPLYGYRQSANGATTKYHPHLLETYLEEYEKLRHFARTNSVLTCELIHEIDIDLIYRMPAILRMNIRSPFSYSTKLMHLKNIIEMEAIKKAACLALESEHSYIAHCIQHKKLNRLFISSIYADFKLRLSGYIKSLASILFKR